MAIIFDFYCRASHMLQSFNSVCNPRYGTPTYNNGVLMTMTSRSILSKTSICYALLCTILEKIKFTEALTAGLTDPAQATPWVALTNLFFRLLLPLEAVHSLTIIFC